MQGRLQQNRGKTCFVAIWLRYASISSHSLGVRLRTRYVRLPIPSMEQLPGRARIQQVPEFHARSFDQKPCQSIVKMVYLLNPRLYGISSKLQEFEEQGLQKVLLTNLTWNPRVMQQ